jgi:hypothetical protein
MMMMMRSDASSHLRRIGKAIKAGTTIGIGMTAMALIVGGLLLVVAWAMVDAALIIADEYASFV